jgi:hypothetical protein
MLTKATAYKKLGISKDSIRTVPKVTLMLKEIMSGLKERGLPEDPYYYLNVSADLDARKLILIYNSIIPSARCLLPLEAFCVAASVDPNSIVDSIVKAITRFNALKSGVSLSASQPDMVQKTIEAASDIENGHKDRRLHMQVSGLMPMPKGSKTIVNVQTSANASSSPTLQAVIVPAPPPEQTVRRLSERLQAVRGLIPAEVQKVEDAVLVDED